jgi:crotonobetaine/carnitine-CoA ligase
MRHDAVADVAVYAVPSPLTEDDIMVAVELAAGASLTEEELFRWLVDRVPYFILPRYVEIRDLRDLPRSDMHTILKGTLREDGVRPTTWDLEQSGITVEKR